MNPGCTIRQLFASRGRRNHSFKRQRVAGASPPPPIAAAFDAAIEHRSGRKSTGCAAIKTWLSDAVGTAQLGVEMEGARLGSISFQPRRSVENITILSERIECGSGGEGTGARYQDTSNYLSEERNGFHSCGGDYFMAL